MKKIIQLSLLTAVLMLPLAGSAQTLTLLWSSDTTLRVPESVLFDKGRDILYVANIQGKSDQKDGNGFISRMATDGKIRDLRWVTGLDAPKGMALVKNTLYVADVSAVVVIDVGAGKITKKIEIAGAQFLNDVTASENGDVYVSDSATGKIHLIRKGSASVYFESADLKRVNGLLSMGDVLYVADAGSGVNYKLDRDKKLTRFTETAQGADGVVRTGDGYIVSSWGGEIFFVKSDGTATRMLDTREKKLNSADIAYDEKTRTVFVPTFFGNSVMAYRFEP